MNLRVKVNNQVFNVSIGNTVERPIRVEVEGEIFEVWPETNTAHQPRTSSKPADDVIPSEVVSAHPSKTPPAVPVIPSPTSASGMITEKLISVRAPIPGVITTIAVQIGSEVSVGQELCKLEAMKMNNSIRANHSGTISAIHISIGQHVKHNDTLMEFAN